MTEIQFEWDPIKAHANEEKHGISFEEARTVFWDEKALLIEDPEHLEEERFILLGLSGSLRLLVVVHVLRAGDTIRILSARKATRKEASDYEGGWR